MLSFFDTHIDQLKGLTSEKSDLLNKELSIFTFGDLLEHYPFRYEDKTQFHLIEDLSDEMRAAQIIGKFESIEILGTGNKQRLQATFCDTNGSKMDLLWFQGINWFAKFLKPNTSYIVYGKPIFFNGRFSITHPEVEFYVANKANGGGYQAVYSLTERLRKKYIDSKVINNWIRNLLDISRPYILETIPENILIKYKLLDKKSALHYLHCPNHFNELHQAQRRLKFEELFFNQLRLLKLSLIRKVEYVGHVFTKTQLIGQFYNKHLPFELTNAQKRVVREIFDDLKSGIQMNRLVQGDVGSGKTIVAFIAMLMAVDGGSQACMMAPTEILAQQHFANLSVYCRALGIEIALLTGSTTKKNRQELHTNLENGSLKILVGTHALFEDVVVFNDLGLVIIDEQHRFGVAQRSRLWDKNKRIRPHIMVMTATPIPRTLAMTLFGDLDISEIDELPPGRKKIKTVHRYDANRLTVFQFIREEIAKGFQVYIVYPLIEESEKLDLKNLNDGFESVSRAFPNVPIGIIHGKMKPKIKDYEMQRFKKGETKIMVATTVIEVGVDVPNANVMIIENAERFGLSQLHQLRGRVGRGADQSYCILITDYKISKDTQKRIETMVETENGFEIAQVDLQLRGPGDMSGTQQSGLVDLKLANLAHDEKILKVAREEAKKILDADPDFNFPENFPIKQHLSKVKNKDLSWSRIS